MRIHIITVGEPKLHYAKIGCLEYEKRLQKYHKVQITRVKGKNQSKESKKIILAAKNSPLVALDPKGQQFSSKSLSQWLDQKAQSAGEIAFAIGGVEGHTEELKKHAHLLWSFSELTFPHDLAMLILFESLYRASTISKGEPYHRE